MKRYTIAILFIAIAMVACSAQAPATQTPPTGGNAGGVPPGTGDAGGVSAATGNVVEVNMTAENFAFSPAVINAKVGDRVIIHIVSSDDGHGIAIDGYNQHVEFSGGTFGADAPTLDFVVDKAGTFTFYCNVPCGRGHRNMKGTLVVQ